MTRSTPLWRRVPAPDGTAPRGWASCKRECDPAAVHWPKIAKPSAVKRPFLLALLAAHGDHLGMRTRALLLAAAVAVLVVIVPGSSARALANTWTGTWDTEWGVMALTQAGSQVKGTYPHDTGHIAGTVTGNLFKAAGPSCRPGRGRPTRARSS